MKMMKKKKEKGKERGASKLQTYIELFICTPAQASNSENTTRFVPQVQKMLILTRRDKFHDSLGSTLVGL